MCCLCIQFTHENTSERTILHLVKKNISPPDLPFQVWLLALQKRLATPLPCTCKKERDCIGIVCCSFPFICSCERNMFKTMEEFKCTAKCGLYRQI